MCIPAQPRSGAARALERLALPMARVRFAAPPYRWQADAAVGCDDEVDADAVERFPDLPPGRRAAVTEPELNR